MNHATMPITEIERQLAEPIFTYEDFVDSMAPHCRCRGPVCGGVLAGGFCDNLALEGDGYDDGYEAQSSDDLDAEGELP